MTAKHEYANMHVKTVQQTSVRTNRKIEVPEQLQAAETVMWGRLPDRGHVAVANDETATDDDRFKYVAVGKSVDDGRFVRPPTEFAEPFDEGNTVFWVLFDGMPVWCLLTEAEFLGLVND